MLYFILFIWKSQLLLLLSSDSLPSQSHVWYVVAKDVWSRFSFLFIWQYLLCFILLWMSETVTGFTGQLIMDILTVVAGKTDCKISNNTPCTISSSSENVLIWIRTTCLSEDTIYPNFLKSWWNGKGSRDILCLEETKMGEQLQHSSKWTHYILCQAKSFLLSQTE